MCSLFHQESEHLASAGAWSWLAAFRTFYKCAQSPPAMNKFPPGCRVAALQFKNRTKQLLKSILRRANEVVQVDFLPVLVIFVNMLSKCVLGVVLRPTCGTGLDAIIAKMDVVPSATRSGGLLSTSFEAWGTHLSRRPSSLCDTWICAFEMHFLFREQCCTMDMCMCARRKSAHPSSAARWMAPIGTACHTNGRSVHHP